MKIVILDGLTANPGDLEWVKLASLGELTIYDRTSPEDILARSADAEIILTNKTPLTAYTLRNLPYLKYVGVLATGYNVVDVKEAASLGITVCNVPSYSTMSVAQNVFALLLDITNSVAHYTAEVKEGKWSKCEDFCYTDTPLIELDGKQIGIVGYGSIGRQVASIAMAFGMKVAVFSSKAQCEVAPAVKMSLDELFSTSDVVSLHCPLTENTRHLVNAERLSKMKKSSVLINTGRGPLVDEEALADALNSGKIAAAGVDVLSQEPPAADNPLLSARNIHITPHISWATKEARTRLLDITVNNIRAFLSGKPVNVVS